MPHKRRLTQEELKLILSLARTVADQPVPELHFSVEELNFDFDVLPLLSAASKLVKPTSDDIKHLPLTGAHPICIRVHTGVIRAFKAQAAKTGSSYQTLMNRALKSAVYGFV